MVTVDGLSDIRRVIAEAAEQGLVLYRPGLTKWYLLEPGEDIEVAAVADAGEERMKGWWGRTVREMRREGLLFVDAQGGRASSDLVVAAVLTDRGHEALMATRAALDPPAPADGD